MKRYLIAPLLLLLACSNSPTTPEQAVTGVSLKRDVAQAPGIDFSCNDFCRGAKAWWSVRFNVFIAGRVTNATVKVYTVNAYGERHYLGMAHTNREESGSFFDYYVEGVAPADSIPDVLGWDNPPSYGIVPFRFDVYGPGHEFLGTGGSYSDVPLTSNLCPNICVGLEHGSTPQTPSSCQSRGNREAPASRE